MKLFLIGGFLGSGKTTAIQQACTLLLNEGVKAAVITNDQGAALVDTGYINSFGIATQQVTNGCFCCNYEQLAQSITSLTETNKPEIIFAESVGSCTDLIATIAKPLGKFIPGIGLVIAVFADASLLYSLVNGTASFLNEEVRYIYKKQLEEADILIINKIDLLREEELESIIEIIKTDYPAKTVLYQDSLNQNDVRNWLMAMDNFHLKNQRQSLELDYDEYAKGEAMLAWLDEELTITSSNNDAYTVAINLISNIENSIRSAGHIIGHLKFLLDDGTTIQKISYTAIANAGVDQLSCPKVNKVSLLINARVQAEPSQLNAIITGAIEDIVSQTNCAIVINTLSSFQPGYPKPTYRIAS